MEEESELGGEIVPEFSIELFGDAVEGHIVHVLIVDEPCPQRHLSGLEQFVHCSRDVFFFVDQEGMSLVHIKEVAL